MMTVVRAKGVIYFLFFRFFPFRNLCLVVVFVFVDL
jgi:hypothetical protein